MFVPGPAADPARPPRSRAPATAADPRRGAPVLRSRITARSATRARSSRSSTRSTASARRDGGRSCSTSARPTASWPPRRRSSRRCRGCRRRRRGLGLRRSCTAPAGLRRPERASAGPARRRRCRSARNRTVRSVSRIAVKPRTTLTAVRVSFMPTLKASRADACCLAAQGVDEERLLRADAAWADGHERGEARVAWTSSTLRRPGRCRTHRA